MSGADLGDCRAALDRARAHAPFLALLADRHAGLAERLWTGDVDGALGAIAPAMAGSDAARSLRIERQQRALVLGIADLAGRIGLDTLTAALSAFADRALDIALETAIGERTPDAARCGFAIIALGKHGGGELNYSSDIDPIFLFDPATLPCRPREEPGEAAVRIGRRVVELLQARDGDGHVFRVDLRLRPSPEVTPIAIPVDAAISWYESSAQPWERAAFVRARACAGDSALGERFLAAIRPFVWRRGLDFGTMAEMQAIARRIRDHHRAGQGFGPGYDLKRGRGGIREVEFFAQIHQLIHGGRDPGLRIRATVPALEALAARGLLDSGESDALASAYRLLRTIEHRLQMVDDQQTHSLPGSREALDNVARLHGLGDGAALLDLLAPHAGFVAAAFDRLDTPRDGASALSLADALAAVDFADPDAAATLVDQWRQGTPRALKGAAARVALENVLPALVAALGQAADPDAAIRRLDAIINQLPTALNLFRLIEAQPQLLRIIADVLAHAPVLAEALGRRADLLDGLIDASAFDRLPPLADLVAELRAGEAGEDYQQLLDRIRRIVGEKRFALGVQLITGAVDPLLVAADYARLAEAALDCLATAAVAEFVAAHGRIAGSELVILALGRLGGEALTYASDLDLVFLFTGDFAAESDGPRPLGGTLYYNRLAQRVIAALSVATAAGPLYQVDTRLRPSGNQGPLAVSLDAFARYQREQAWTWEHMALTRARPVFGSPAARAALAPVVAESLAGPRDRATVLADAARMRADIRRHKPPAGPLDVKLIDGGLVDLEFIVHTHQLGGAGPLTPRLGEAVAALAGAGVLPASLVAAHDLLTRMLVMLRLCCPTLDDPGPATRIIVARACGCRDWDALLADYAVARQSVSHAWHGLFGPESGVASR